MVAGRTLARAEEREVSSPMDCKQKGKGCHSLFSARELVHVPEAFHRWHCMILDAMQVRFLAADQQSFQQTCDTLTSLSSRLR